MDLADGGRPALAVAYGGRPAGCDRAGHLDARPGASRCAGRCGTRTTTYPYDAFRIDETADRIAGLQAGGDDYLVKPFALQELVLRLEALLRRRPPRDSGASAAGRLLLDPAARRVTSTGGRWN